jgi:hypothetical protein
MKRSEVVNKVQCLLEDRGYVGNSDDGEAVLSLIEQLGMLPPPQGPIRSIETIYNESQAGRKLIGMRNELNLPYEAVMTWNVVRTNKGHPFKWESENTCQFCETSCDNPECYAKDKK